MLIVWFETFVEYDDALKSFTSKFKQVYKDIIKKPYKSKAKVDMKRIFQQSKSQMNAMVNGSKVYECCLREINLETETITKSIVLKK